MKKLIALFASLLMSLNLSLMCSAWGDVVVETTPVRNSGADTKLLVLMAFALAVMLVSLGATIYLRKEYLSEKEENKKEKNKKKKK